MIITIHIDRWDITKILIDNGSQAEIIFLLDFKKWATIESSLRSQRSHSAASVAKELNLLGS
jgi:hypothetical protein